MISLAPSFPGDSEIDTLFKIFQALGTPTEESWPGVEQLKDWHATFPKWSAPSDAAMCHALHIRPEHGLDPDGIDLLRRLLTLCPARRISARQALQHPWFTKAKLHCMSERARSRLDAQAARVARAATVRAAERKAEKLRRKAEARRAAGSADDSGADDAASEEFEQDQLHDDPAADETDHACEEDDDEQGSDGEQDHSALNSSSSVSSQSP